MGIADPGQPAQVYGRRFDMWTTRATDLLDRAGIPHVFVDLDEPGMSALGNELIRETRCYQTPYVFLRGRFVGGFAELDELERLGQLVDHADHGVAVEVVRRPQEFVPPALRKP